MSRREKIIFTWLTVTFCLFFAGLLIFDRRPRLLNVLDIVFFCSSFYLCGTFSFSRFQRLPEEKLLAHFIFIFRLVLYLLRQRT